MSYSYQYTGDSLTVVDNRNGVPFHVQGTETKFKAVLEALQAGQWNKVSCLIDELKALRRFSNGKIRVEGSVVYFNNEALHPELTRRLLQLYNAGVSLNRFENFLTKLKQNPSYASQNELLLFLEGNNLCIHEDGDFFAYKSVRKDYKDHHTGKFDNSPGATPFMKRQDVDDDRNRTCSRGLHFSSLDYAKNFGYDKRIVSVKINPADVVSIPYDYNNQKGRTWKYTVVADITDQVDNGNDPLSQYTDADIDTTSFNDVEDDDFEINFDEIDEEENRFVQDGYGDQHYYDDAYDEWFIQEGYEWDGTKWN